MSVSLEQVIEISRIVHRQVRDAFKPLSLYFIAHNEGRRREALAMAAQDIVGHPASETALHILQKMPPATEESALLGIAVARENLFLGLAWRNSLLAMCTMNTDHFDSLAQARRQAYFLAWHAIDAFEYQSSKGGSFRRSAEIIIRRRNALEMARANMKADIFSAVMSALQGDREAIRDIARMRAFNALQPRSGMMPEYYPYMLVMEATEMAFQSLSRKALSKRALIPAALRLALEISKAYDDESLMPWLTFCEPAQDMAWRGYGPAHILSAAINTSPHTAVQTTGQLAGYIINVEPASFFDIRGAFSAFADDEINGKVHEKIVDSIFEDILATGLKEKNVDALLKLANKQNEDLTEGRVAGWCASALQAAARAFDMHYEREGEAENAARRKFRDERTHTAWSDLRILGNKVLEQQRQGEIVTLSRVAELSGKDSNLESVRKSIDMTLKDPSFQSRLKAASELSNSVAPRPRGPGLEARPGGPRGPAPQASPALGKTRTITESGQRHQEKEDGKQGAVE